MRRGRSQTSAAVALTVAALGAVTLILQGALFRSAMWCLESTELGVALFLATWLLWHGIGSALYRAGGAREQGFMHATPCLLLLLVPAYLVHDLFLLHARGLSGIPVHLQLPVIRMVVVLLCCNIPVALVGGWLFPAMCDWAQRERGVEPGRVYLWEALGGAVGGVLFTVALLLGCQAEAIALACGLAVGGGAIAPSLARRRSWVLPTAVILLGAVLGTVAGTGMATYGSRRQWEALVGAAGPAGRLQTAQSKYLWGAVGDSVQVFRHGHSVCALPEDAQTEDLAAMLRLQAPAARRFIVADDAGYGLCRALLRLGAERVGWSLSDPAFGRALHAALPESVAIPGEGFEILQRPLGRSIESLTGQVDLVYLALEPLSGATAMQALSPSFVARIRRVLGPQGILVLQFAAGANAQSPESALLGGVIQELTRELGPQRLLLPGASACLMLSDAAVPGLTSAPAELRRRGAALKIAPPSIETAVRRIEPSRRAAQQAAYVAAARTMRSARARAACSRAPRLALGQGLEREWPGANVTRLLRHITRWLPWCWAVVGGCVWLVCGLAYVRARSCRPGVSAAACWLAAGAALGLLVQIGLLVLLQVRFGNVYLLFALACSSTMLGMALGAWGMLKARCPLAPQSFAVVSVLHLLVGAAGLVLAHWAPLPLCLLLFLLTGCAAGCYAPLVVSALHVTGRTGAAAGRWLVLAESIGASVAGGIAGVWALPLLGFAQTFMLAGAVMAGAGVVWTILALQRRQAWGLARSILGVATVGGLLAAVLTWPGGSYVTDGASDAPPTLVDPIHTVEPATSARGIETPIEEAGRQPRHQTTTETPAARESETEVGAAPEAEAGPPQGRPRRVNMRRLRQRQAAGQLSDREAEFYVPLPDP